ncbi:MAG: mraW [Parachlamydiales bacterium]|nr:mraW [Parachlamydiales bacterium]
MSVLHKPVMLQEVLAIFQGMEIRHFFDGTLGAGGHARAILEAHPEIEKYFGCDRDEGALRIAEKELTGFKEKLRLIHGSHSEMMRWLQDAKIPCVQGVLIDAGVSSMQLDFPERGFSFQADGPLDMRMDPTAELTAFEIVNRYREADLEKILRDFGEEPRARAIARTIVAARKKGPIRTTGQLACAIRPVARGKKHLHFATLTFQALRIAVNDELNVLKRGIEQGIEALCPGGKIVIISFHRLEDRISKNCLRDEQMRPAKRRGEEAVGCLEIITKKPLEPSQEEIKSNYRCRSAKLRAAMRV